MTLANLEEMIKMMKVLKLNQLSNKLFLKKSLLFALHYVNFKRFIMKHQHPPLYLEAYNFYGSHLKQIQKGNKNQL